MKKIYTLLTICLFTTVIQAQVVSWSPFFPTENDTVSIIFNPNEGNKKLAAADTPFYAHTAVITNLSTSSSDWKHTKFDWAVNDPSVKLKVLSNNLYLFKLNTSVKNFYNVTGNESVQKMAMVFRNKAGNLVAKTNSEGDIFVPIYKAGLNCVFTQTEVDPNDPYIDSSNAILNIIARASKDCELKLLLNNTLITTVTNDSLKYNLTNFAEGTNWVKIIASDGGATASDSFMVINPPSAKIANLEAGIKDGVNYINDTTVILSIYAPGKKNIAVIGDFNNWTTNDSSYLFTTPDHKRFWIKISHLTKGKEYGYQFKINNDLVVPDPYAEKVLDPNNDSGIPSVTYPESKTYPTGKTTGIVGVLQSGQAPYNWTVQKFAKPQKTDLVIYEILLRDFVGTHRYSTLKDSLNYLKKLGVNAIELMPINEFEGNNSWGYNTSFYLTPDKYYGTKNSLKEFIDKAHSMGIAVIMDIALNHSFGQSPFAQMYWDKTNSRPAANNPWFNVVETHPFNVGNDFNHESEATKYMVRRVTEFWIKEFNIDGYRFDLSKGFTQKNTLGNENEFGKKDTSRIKIWKGIADHIRSVDSTAYMVLEHLADNEEEKPLADYGFLLWGNMHPNYSQAAMGYTSNSDFGWGFYKNRGWSKPNLVSYMESHDEERLMVKVKTSGNANAKYSTKSAATSLERMGLCAAFFFTVPGPKMIWQFGELGYDISIDQNGRTGTKPFKWNYFTEVDRRKLFNIYAALINLKTSHPALKTTNAYVTAANAVKTVTLNHASMNVRVMGNFGIVAGNTTPNYLTIGTWYDYLSGDSIVISASNTTIPLQPGEYHIYTNKRLSKPDMSVGMDEPISVGEPARLGVYPNPANTISTVALELKEASDVKIKIFNIMGAEIKNLADQHLFAGQHEINWDLNNYNGTPVPNGIYFIQAVIGNKTVKSKIMVQK